MSIQGNTLSETLQRARRARQMSQLELALRLGVSQRHISYVENSRSKPSRPLLNALLRELKAPLDVQNAAMLQAGFAPVYQARSMAHPALAEVDFALRKLLDNHDPMPCLVIDAHWNLLDMNRGARWLASTLMPWTINLPQDASLNLLDLIAHPTGLAASIVNLDEVGPALLAQLREDAAVLPTLLPRVDAVAQRFRDRLGTHSVLTTSLHSATPLLTTRYTTVHGELSFFSLYTTFGTPRDITLESLKVEHLFAADKLTRSVLQANVI